MTLMRLFINNIYISLTFSILFMVLATAPALADESIVITSDTLAADRKANIAVFEGSVVAKTGDMVLNADRMTAHYGEAGSVSSIEAEGSVKVVRGLQVVTSGSAFYDVEGRKMTFTGEPRAVDEGNVFMGTKIIYYLDNGRMEVEGSTMIIEDLGGPSEGGNDD